jgi:hypothetical protein
MNQRNKQKPMTTSNEVSVKEPKAILRPLKVLASLIKEDIANGDAAAERAGMPYYRAAGEKLVEAKAQVPHGEWMNWVRQNFDRSHDQAHRYMMLAREYARERILPKTLSEVTQPHTEAGHKVHWHAPVKNIFEGISHEQFIAQIDNKMNEKKLRKQMALELIDAGFKMLALKLHPDKGGSDEAMRRLTEVYKELKALVA